MPSDAHDDLPYSIHMALWTRRSAAWVMRRFKAAGWSWRNSAWDEFEVACDDAELDIASKNPILISGGISQSDDTIHRIIRILAEAGIKFELEVYDENDQLIESHSSDEPTG